MSCPVVRLHNRTVESRLPVANIELSGLNARQLSQRAPGGLEYVDSRDIANEEFLKTNVEGNTGVLSKMKPWILK